MFFRRAEFGAGDGIRTRDIDLGKVALYQLSYSRPTEKPIFARKHSPCQMELRVLRKHNKTQLLYCCVGVGPLCYATLLFQTVSLGIVFYCRKREPAGERPR